MTKPAQSNGVRRRRLERCMTQSELANRSGVSRASITAIEAGRLTPSVATALAIARTLGTTVEELFSPSATAESTEIWAWSTASAPNRFWSAAINGRIVRYPAHSMPLISIPPETAGRGHTAIHDKTLVVAGCDPSSGLLAEHALRTTSLRLIVLHRSSRPALELLRDGLAHLAGVHFSTAEEPDRNAAMAQQVLGPGFLLIRAAAWEAGIAAQPAARVRSIRSARSPGRIWVGREAGSGARQCLDRILSGRSHPRHEARDHRGVAEAIRSGWAEVGVCLKIVCDESGLDFLPVQKEFYDLCIPKDFLSDRRMKRLLNLLRSREYRDAISKLPGYDSTETGNIVAKT